MLAKEFVPYDLAVKLKELGFNQESLGFYNIDSELMCRSTLKRTNSEVQGVVIAPLWQQAFEFFRELNLSGEIYHHKDFWYFDIRNTNLNIDMFFKREERFLSQKEARMECMKEIINYLEYLK